MSAAQPKSVVYFMALNICSLVVGQINSFAFPDFYAANGTSAPALSTRLLIVGTFILLLVFLWNRQNWARWLYLVLFGLGLLFTPFALPMFFAYSSMMGLLNLCGLLIGIAAIIILFRKDSREWFRLER